MKKILYVIIIMLLSIVLTGCEKKYDGPKIIAIEYQTIDYNGGYTECKKIDFINNKVYSKEYLPEVINEIEYKEKFAIDENKTEEFINKINNIGLLNLKKEYKPLLTIIDGSEWNLVITFEDLSTKVSKGKNASPDKIFKKTDYVFYDLFGEEFFGLVAADYKNPPSLSISYFEKESNTQILDQSIIKTNYTWKNKVVNDINNFVYPLMHQHIEFKENYTYTATISTSYMSEKFKNLTLKEYDVNGNLIKEVFKTKWFNKKTINISLDRVYIATAEFSNGLVEYVFATTVAKQDEMPLDFSFCIIGYEDNKQVLSYDSNTKILSNEYNSIIYELSDNDLFEIYNYLYINNIRDMKYSYEVLPNDREHNTYISFNHIYKCSGKSITLSGAKIVDDINIFNEGQEAANIIYNIYNKYIKNKYESISNEPFELLIDTLYSSDKMTVKLFDDTKCSFTYLDMEYICNYYVAVNQLVIEIENNYGGSYFHDEERFYFYIGDNILIFKEHHGDSLDTSDIKIGTILTTNNIKN